MDKVFLGPITEAVRHALDEDWFSDEDVNYKMGFGKSFLGRGKAQAMLDDMLTEVAYGIYEGTEPIGFVRVRHGAPDSKTARVWMFIAPDHRRSGAGKAAMAQVLERMFREAKRVEAEVLCINEESMKFLKSVGFVPEGRKRNAHYMHGHGYTVAPFRMLKPHWKNLKARSMKQEQRRGAA